MKYALLSIVVVTLLCGEVVLAGTAVYDGIPSPDPTASPSLGYQATQTSEFGDHIGLAGTARDLQAVRVGLVSWAEYDGDYTSSGAAYTDPDLVMDQNGWRQELTLNIYTVDNTGSVPAPGGLLATKTDVFTIPFAPGDGTHPFAPVTFDFSDQGVTLPNEIIYGIAFNTRNYGASPTGYIGPYCSLNVACGGNGDSDTGYIAPTVGTDIDPDAVMWSTITANWYADGGAAGVGTFRQDTAWAPYTPMVEVVAADPVPEPASMITVGMAVAGLGGYIRKRRVA